MSRLNHSTLCDESPPPNATPPNSPPSPHLQCWSPVHVVAVYHSRRRETHWAVMDGPRAKTAPIAYQLPISTLLAGCQCAPHPSQVNEIRRKCRYNGAFCRVQITQCQLCCPPVGAVRRWMRERGSRRSVCVCVYVCLFVNVCMRSRPCACHEAIRWFPRLICPVEAQLLACYLFALLIADHTSYVTSPRILQVNLSLSLTALLLPQPLPLGGTVCEMGGGGGACIQTGARTSTIAHSHTHRWGDSDGWHYRSCVAANGLLKWLIKGKQLLHRGTDGATPPTGAGTQASEENTRGSNLANDIIATEIISFDHRDKAGM